MILLCVFDFPPFFNESQHESLYLFEWPITKSKNNKAALSDKFYTTSVSAEGHSK
jgi:hypothetical protein